MRVPHLLVRCELLNGGTSFRGVTDLEHGTLCKAFSLDPCSTYFDLPKSAFEMRQGAAGRRINGVIFQGAKDRPIGKLTVAREGERFSDYDGADQREFFNFSRS